jgi:hypothetical protein
MDEASLQEELIRVAARLGVEVRVEPFETPAAGAGGFCRFQGRALVLLDARAPRSDRVRALARALGRLDVDAIYMAPEARAAIESASGPDPD